MDRQVYFSQRTGKNTKMQKLDLETFKKLFLTQFYIFYSKDYFRGTFGYNTHNSFQDNVEGPLGDDYTINQNLFLKLRKEYLWPIRDHISSYSEDDLFDIIEYCYDNISIAIVEYEEDNFSGYTEKIKGFSQKEGQVQYRTEINRHLKDYGDGFAIDSNGNIVRTVGFGLEPILEAKLPTSDIRILPKVEYAIQKYRSRNSSIEDRRDAIRNLVDVLEYIRPQVKESIDKNDESDLFNIANNFGIRHNNKQQKINYDENIWLSWMFYYYLSTIHAFIRVLKKAGKL